MSESTELITDDDVVDVDVIASTKVPKPSKVDVGEGLVVELAFCSMLEEEDCTSQMLDCSAEPSRLRKLHPPDPDVRRQTVSAEPSRPFQATR